MTTLSYTPSYSSALRQKPQVNVAQFGDGYSQRAAKGINNNPQEWSVTFDSLTDADATAIDDFFIAAGGALSFDWTPPGKPAAKWVCTDWQRSHKDFSQEITATLTQVFGT